MIQQQMSRLKRPLALLPSIKMMPRKKRCFFIFAAVSMLYVVFYLTYSLTAPPALSYDAMLKKKEFNSPEHLIDELEKEIEVTKLAKDYNKYWRYYTELHDYRVELDADSYKQIRATKHFYDPRITVASYVHHIRKHDGEGAVHMPFSWQDWIDFSVFNQYLEYDEKDKPNCVDILAHEERYQPSKKGKMSDLARRVKLQNKFNSQPCVENSRYTGPIDKSLLPGFNFNGRTMNGDPWEKMIHARSYMMTAMTLPKSIVFLSDEGVYEAYISENQNIVQSGVYDELVADLLKPGSEEQLAAPGVPAGEETVPAGDPEAEAQNEGSPDARLVKRAPSAYPYAKPAAVPASLPSGTIEKREGRIVVDPILEFNLLRAEGKATRIGRDFNSLFTEENNYEYEIPMDDFYYDYSRLIEELSKKEKRSSKEESHLRNLKYSAERPESKLGKGFQEVNLIWPPPTDASLKENGGHYDWRFFGGFITRSKINAYDDVMSKRKLLLHRMLHTWQQFTYRSGVASLLAHGSLIAWYWDGLVFEWDDDIDVQLPIMELDRLCAAYNQSMIVEDPRFGFHKYFLHCGDSLTHRSKGNGMNNIDARFIDVDTGMFIDITGLAFTGTKKVPVRFRETWKKIKEEDVSKHPAPGYAFPLSPEQQKVEDKILEDYMKKKKEDSSKRLVRRGAISPEGEDAFTRNTRLHIVNCRNNHFYSYEELSPVHLSSMEGAPVLIPKDYRTVISSEYSKGLIRNYHKKYAFVDSLRIWYPTSKLAKLLQDIRPDLNFRSKTSQRILDVIKNEPMKSLVNMLKDDEIMNEFYLTHDQTRNHKREMDLLKKLEKDGSLSSADKSEYIKIEEGYKGYGRPLRKDYYTYLIELQMLQDQVKLHLEEGTQNGLEEPAN